MKDQYTHRMAIIVRNTDAAKALKYAYEELQGFKMHRDGHRLVFASPVHLPENVLINELRMVRKNYCEELATAEICVEYLDDHTRDYKIRNHIAFA